MDAVLERAIGDARRLEAGGVHGVLVENYGDAPFFPGAVPQETLASLAVAVAAVRAETSLPVGVNVLRNDAIAALAVATATGAGFIRVNVHSGSMFTDQGLLHGRAHETLRRRAWLRTDVAVLADVFVKHGTPPPGTRIEDAARDARERGLADGLIVSGSATGSATDPADVSRVAAAVPGTPVWVGSGATMETAPGLLEVADGIIVGSFLEEEGVAGRPVDPDRVAQFMDAVNGH